MVLAAALLAGGCGSDGPALEALVAALPPSAEVVDRLDDGPPAVVVLEVPQGDPRASGGDGAAEVARALLDAGASGLWLASGDGADDLVHALGPELRDRVHVLPGPDADAVRAVRRFAGVVEERTTPLAGLRDVVLSGVAPPDTVRGYIGLR